MRVWFQKVRNNLSLAESLHVALVCLNVRRKSLSDELSELYSVQEYYINDNCMNEFYEQKAKIEESLSRVNVSIDAIGGLLGICLEH